MPRNPQHDRDRSRWRGVLAGVVGGLAGAWTMNQFQAALSRAQPQQPSSGDDATQKAAAAMAQPFLDRPLTRDEKRVGGPVVHYAFGSIMGGLYGAMAEARPRTSLGWGLPFGAVVWLGADEIGVPLAGLSQSATEAPLSTHASALAAHLVYGATADAVRRAVRAAFQS